MLSAFYDNVKTLLVYKDKNKELSKIEKNTAKKIVEKLSSVYIDYLSNPFNIDIKSAVAAWIPDYDKFENNYLDKTSNTDDSFIKADINYEDYSDLAEYHFKTDIKRIYDFVSPLCAVFETNKKNGKKK